jgi:nitrate reductase gamma subunit
MIHLTTLIGTAATAALAQSNTTTKPLFPDPPSSTELMLRGLLSASLYGVLGILLMLLGFWLFDLITPKIDVQKELAENKNIALAVVVAAMLIGLAIMLGRVISA